MPNSCSSTRPPSTSAAIPAPLATEALRGEGATLINASGERFMRAVHPDAELAPRDIVARAVHREVMQRPGRLPRLPGRARRDLADDFPTVFTTCRSRPASIRRRADPVAPAAHYHMGGILTDAKAAPRVDGLWACGEVASTGAHGANRLASNSLLEAVVFAARVADDIAEHSAATAVAPKIAVDRAERAPRRSQPEAEQPLRRTMAADVGVVRDAQALTQGADDDRRARAEDRGDPQLANMLTTAKLITAAALVRTESRGAHFRSDYPARTKRTRSAASSPWPRPASHRPQGGRRLESAAPARGRAVTHGAPFPGSSFPAARRARGARRAGRGSRACRRHHHGPHHSAGRSKARRRSCPRQPGVVAGLDLAEAAFRTLDPDDGRSRALVDDGGKVDAAAIIARVRRAARRAPDRASGPRSTFSAA